MKKFILSLVAICSATFAFAQMEKPVKWSYTAKKISPTEYELHMTAVIGNKWHLYAQDAGEGPIPTTITFEKNALVKFDGKVKEIGKLEKVYEPVYKSVLSFFQTKVDFVQKVKLKVANKTALKGKIDYMTCNDSKCLPGNVSFDVKIDPKS